jgi:nucleotide-binding universal stress UspA family protein
MNEQLTQIILAAVSLDDAGDLALRAAAHSASQYTRSALHVVHVVSEYVPDERDADPSPAQNILLNARGQLHLRVEALASPQALYVVGHIRAGAPHKGILQVAAEIDADLIVVGTHKRTGIRRFILGSVAERVLRDAHCPVLVAMVKDHAVAMESSVVEPPCGTCTRIRSETAEAMYWCERHSRLRMRPHVYEPSDTRRASPVI